LVAFDNELTLLIKLCEMAMPAASSIAELMRSPDDRRSIA
jgi:hypothetical protein